MKEYNSDTNKLKAKLVKEEATGLFNAYPDFPKDLEGNPISTRKASELLAQPIAGVGNKDNKAIRDINRLKSQYGGDDSDYTKLSTIPRDIGNSVNPNPQNIEFHSYKNIKTGKVYEIKPVDTQLRALEAKEKAKLSKEMSTLNSKPKDMSNKNEMLSQIKRNASDITSNSEALKKKLNENIKDITPTKKEIIAKKFSENKPVTPTKKEVIEKKKQAFDINKKDILGDKGPDKKGPDKPEKFGPR